MVTSWHENFTGLVGRTEPDVIAWFDANAHPGETWLDIGANYGYTALRLAGLVGSSGRVFAFEPKLSTAGYLSQTMALNGLSQVTIVPAGLNTPDSIEIQRFHTCGSMAVGAGCVHGALETVMIAKLDWLWPRICGGNQRVDGVKIDVQGMELGVLRGMEEILARDTPRLIVELHHGVDRAELVDLLEGCGYDRRATAVFHAQDESLERDNFSYAFTPRQRA